MDIELFELKSDKPFGRGYRCKTCKNQLSKEYRAKHKEYYAKYLHEYMKKYVPKRKYARKYIKKEYKPPSEARKEYIRQYWRTHKKKVNDKVRSRKRFYRSILDGRTTKQPCSVCGNLLVEGHHPDYSKPFGVVWLCRKHHIELHRDKK